MGPLPKGRRGVKYLFTYICLASRWPEAQLMRTASATEASQCFFDIISRTGIPLKVLSDSGSVFLSKLMNGLYERLGIDLIATSPYRPQSNGIVERFHGMLKPMLAKARDSDVDWADFLPLALFAIRQVPNIIVLLYLHQTINFITQFSSNIFICQSVCYLTCVHTYIHIYGSSHLQSFVEAAKNCLSPVAFHNTLKQPLLCRPRLCGLTYCLLFFKQNRQFNWGPPHYVQS